jgi:hypothetical protein
VKKSWLWIGIAAVVVYFVLRSRGAKVSHSTYDYTGGMFRTNNAGEGVGHSVGARAQ